VCKVSNRATNQKFSTADEVTSTTTVADTTTTTDMLTTTGLNSAYFIRCTILTLYMYKLVHCVY